MQFSEQIKQEGKHFTRDKLPDVGLNLFFAYCRPQSESNCGIQVEQTFGSKHSRLSQSRKKAFSLRVRTPPERECLFGLPTAAYCTVSAMVVVWVVAVTPLLDCAAMVTV